MDHNGSTVSHAQDHGWLVLSRLLHERICILIPGIEEPVWVSVLEIVRGRVRLAFHGPPEVKIYREELFDKINKDSQDAIVRVERLTHPSK